MENMTTADQGQAPEKTRRAVVYGRVQGVFFRDSCRRRAQELGVRGWVRNRRDGAVEAVFSGNAPDVDAMVTWTHTGPPQANVSEVQVTDAKPPGTRQFEVC